MAKIDDRYGLVQYVFLNLRKVGDILTVSTSSGEKYRMVVRKPEIGQVHVKGINCDFEAECFFHLDDYRLRVNSWLRAYYDTASGSEKILYATGVASININPAA